MTTRLLFISYMKALNSLELLKKIISTSTLPRPLPSTCSIGLLDGFPTGKFIRFSICPTKVETLHSCAAFAGSDPGFEDSTVVLLLNFGGILQQIACLTLEYAQLNIICFY